MKINLLKLTVFATNRDFKMWCGGANKIVITAIISPLTIKKPTNKLVSRTIRQIKVVDSSVSHYIRHLFDRTGKATEKSIFDSLVLQRFRFWTKIISTCQILKWKYITHWILNWKFFGMSVFLKKTLQSKNHVLTHFTSWIRHILHFRVFFKKSFYNTSHLELKNLQDIRFWNKIFLQRVSS